MLSASRRPVRSFDAAVLARLRSLPLSAALDQLGLYWKPDPDFRPVKDSATVRVNVSVGNGAFELLVTGLKWYDTRAEKGGGGAIDLVMHLFNENFVAAVKRLGG